MTKEGNFLRKLVDLGEAAIRGYSKDDKADFMTVLYSGRLEDDLRERMVSKMYVDISRRYFPGYFPFVTKELVEAYKGEVRRIEIIREQRRDQEIRSFVIGEMKRLGINL